MARKNIGKEKVFMFLFGHGGVETRKAPKKADAEPDTPRQGATITPINNVVEIALASDFLVDLYEDVPDGVGSFIYNDPLATRVTRPQFLLTTANESITGEVNVLFDNIPVGSLLMENSSIGGDYALTLSDQMLLDLIPLLADGALNIAFSFDSTEDWVQIAAEGDFYFDTGFEFGHFGLGIATAAFNADDLPEPSTMFNLAIGVIGILILAGRRYRPARMRQ